MTPKEKAAELVEKHFFKCFECGDSDTAKQHALLTVEEIINSFKEFSIGEHGSVYVDYGHGYWEEVKEELEKL